MAALGSRVAAGVTTQYLIGGTVATDHIQAWCRHRAPLLEAIGAKDRLLTNHARITVIFLSIRED